MGVVHLINNNAALTALLLDDNLCVKQCYGLHTNLNVGHSHESAACVACSLQSRRGLR